MKPNVILIVADTLRKDYSSNLDKLLEFGFNKIDKAFTTSPWTLPAHVRLLDFTHIFTEFMNIMD